MGDVGDVDGQPPAAALAFNVDGIVVVLRVVRVDRQHGLFAEVFAAVKIRGRDDGRDRLRFLKHGGRKFFGKVVTAHQREQIHPASQSRPEHFEHFPLRIDVPAFPRVEPDHYLVPLARGRGQRLLRFAQIDVVSQTRIVGDDVLKPFRGGNRAHDRLVGGHQDTHHAGLRSASALRLFPPLVHLAREYAVAVHRGANIHGGQEKVPGPTFRVDQLRIPPGEGQNRPRHQVCGRW